MQKATNAELYEATQFGVACAQRFYSNGITIDSTAILKCASFAAEFLALKMGTDLVLGVYDADYLSLRRGVTKQILQQSHALKIPLGGFSFILAPDCRTYCVVDESTDAITKRGLPSEAHAVAHILNLEIN